MWLCRCSDIGYGRLERVAYLVREEWEVLGYTDVMLKRTLGCSRMMELFTSGYTM